MGINEVVHLYQQSTGKMTQGNTLHTAPVMGISRHRLSTDGRGVTTLVGLHGCPLNCLYCLNNNCHTPDGIWRTMTTQELYEAVKIDDIYFRSTGGGITFGGGEPALHSEYIEQFCKQYAHGWNITIESSLNAPLHHIKRLAQVANAYIIDIKTLDREIYRRYTGLEIDRAIENLQYLISRGDAGKIVVRTPLIPYFNTLADVEETTQVLQSMGIKHFAPLTYSTNIVKQPRKESLAGKTICNVLKRIRTIIANANNIEYTPTPCTHTTCATGNCPMCEKELAWLSQQIQQRDNVIL